MEKNRKKGNFADWKLTDWCIYATFILLCFLLIYGSWYFIKTGRYFIGVLLAICFILLLLLCLIPIFSKPVPQNIRKYTPLQVSLPETEESFLELVKSIGANDNNLLKEVAECLTKPESFLEKIQKTAKEEAGNEDWDLYKDLSDEYEEYKAHAKNSKIPFFQGALILLAYKGMVARFDWKVGREIFILLMNNLKTVYSNGLAIDENILSESEDVEQLCGQLDTIWQTAGYHTVLIDNDSDEYIVGIQKN